MATDPTAKPAADPELLMEATLGLEEPRGTELVIVPFTLCFNKFS
jgi:hypothetical protein